MIHGPKLSNILKSYSSLLDEVAAIPAIVVGDQVEWGYNKLPQGTGKVIDICRLAVNTVNRSKVNEGLVVQTADGKTQVLPHRRLIPPYTLHGYFIRKVD